MILALWRISCCWGMWWERHEPVLIVARGWLKHRTEMLLDCFLISFLDWLLLTSKDFYTFSLVILLVLVLPGNIRWSWTKYTTKFFPSVNPKPAIINPQWAWCFNTGKEVCRNTGNAACFVSDSVDHVISSFPFYWQTIDQRLSAFRSFSSFICFTFHLHSNWLRTRTFKEQWRQFQQSSTRLVVCFCYTPPFPVFTIADYWKSLVSTSKEMLCHL